MRNLGIALIVLAAGIVGVAILGPFGMDAIRYHVVDDVLNQVTGADAAAVFVVAPVCLLAGVLALRGHRAAPALALGPAGFSVYTYAQLALGGDFAARPGNSERFFPLFLALFILGGWILVRAWLAIDPARLPGLSDRLRTVAGTTLVVLALFLTFGLHLGGVIDVINGEPHAVEYTQSPAVFWIVKLMDLGIVVPLALVAGVGLLRDRHWATKLSSGILGWGALLGSSVAGMGIVMIANDDPASSIGLTTGFVVFALIFLVLAGLVFRPLLSEAASRAPRSADQPVRSRV